MRQVISGLIENALKKSVQGGAIEVCCKPSDTGAYLTVTDEGEGIEAGESERIFGRFARGARDVTGSGFGVGLALARWVVERQDGTIALTSPAPSLPVGGTGRGPGVQIAITLPTGAGEAALTGGHDHRSGHLG